MAIEHPNPSGDGKCGYTWCSKRMKHYPVVVCFERTTKGKVGCRGCLAWVPDIAPGSVLQGLTKERLKEELKMSETVTSKRAANLDDQGNYVGNNPKVSDGVRELYNKIPKCGACQETFLYTKKAQAEGICAKCRKAAQRAERQVEAEARATEKLAEEKAKLEAADAAAQQAAAEAVIAAEAESAEE